MLLAGAARAGDWPQWRGPARNGIAVGEPTPTAPWSEKGPPEVWRAPIFRAKNDGGLGNPVVADGRVFIFLSPQEIEDVPSRSFDAEALRGTGWFDDPLPAELLAQLEADRVGGKASGLKPAERAAWAEKWTAARLTPEQEGKWGQLVRARLQKGAAALPLALFPTLAKLKDKKFESQPALDEWLTEHSLTGAVAAAVNKVAIKTVKHQSDQVLAFDAATGKELWRHEAPGTAHQWGLSGTPAVADGRVYIVGSTGHAYCFAAADGRLVWQQQIGEASSASFLVADGLAVVPAQTLTALDAATGAVRWRADAVKTDSSSPVLWRADGAAYLLSNTGKGVYCVELATGTVRWQVPGGLHSTVAVEGDVMAVMSGAKEHGLSAYRITPGQATRLWKVDVEDRGSSPVIADGCVYAYAKGKVVGVRLADGKQLWTQETGGGEITPLVLVGHRLLAAAGGGRLAMLDATPGGKGEIVAKAKVGLPTATSPTIANGKMYLRTETALVCYDLMGSR